MDERCKLPRKRCRRPAGFWKLVSWVLTFAMVAPLCGAVASALAEPWTDGLCPHHPAHNAECGYVPSGEEAPCAHEHDGDCGYAQPAEGAPCGHVHDADCGYAEAREAAACTHVHDEACGGEDACTHVHDEACGYDAGQAAGGCAHEHSETCGYVPASEGAPCGHVHDEACGYTAPEAGVPCGYACGRCVLGWQWADPDGVLQWSEEAGAWALCLPGVGEEMPLTEEDLLSLLPAAVLAETPAGVREVPIVWSGLPEAGASAGAYALYASLTEEDCVLREDVPDLEILLEIGGGETFDEYKLAINDWIWEGYNKRGTEAVCAVIVDDIQTPEAMVERLKEMLPKRIYGWSVGTKNSYEFYEFEKSGSNANYVNISWGYLTIDWSNLTIGQDVDYKKDFVIRAKAPNNGTYYLNDDNDEAVPLDITVHPVYAADHIIPAASPENTRVNLFDYWVEEDGSTGANDLLTGSDYHWKEDHSENVNRSGVDSWDQGINSGRALLFGDGNIHAGFWNKGAGAGSQYGKANAGMMGIVERTLGEDGYPQINTGGVNEQIEGFAGISDWQLCGDHDGDIGTSSAGAAHGSKNPKNLSDTVQEKWEAAGGDASLAYLFDPSVQIEYKYSYPDIAGLFQIDNNGYYYYDMRQNFAELDAANKEFILYDAPAVERTDKSYTNGGFVGGRSVGNFLPFNTCAQVFDGIQDGKLYSSENIKTHNGQTNGAYMNHHLGMTVEIDFRQPANGKINMGTQGMQPMSFLFSGDDDVWVFIDDVLVLDLGGIHSEIYGTIDFSNGEVSVGQSWKTNGFPMKADGTVDVAALQENSIQHTTIKAQFINALGEEAANALSWRGDTFASETNHTLKMFFLERGNYDSSLAVRFNLQPPLPQQIKKVDQEGQPIEDVGFSLYPAEVCEDPQDCPNAIDCLYTDASVNDQKAFRVKETGGEALAALVTGPDGVVEFRQGTELFNFADQDTQFFVLKETKTPPGYRSLPVPVVLYYDTETGMLSVANRWTTGAYACSVSNIVGVGGLTYGKFDNSEGGIGVDLDKPVNAQKQSESLIVAVPMLWQTQKGKWVALHGSNIGGFQAVVPEERSAEKWREAALRAVLEQAANSETQNWYLSWNSANRQLVGTLSDLPGLASRYRLNNENGDMRMVYGILEKEALSALGISGSNAQERYEQLGAYVRAHGADDTLKVIMNTEVDGTASGRGFSFLNVDQFNRNFRSLIYIPNEQRELRVQKVDGNGKGLAGAEFGVFTPDDRKVASGTTDEDGLLVFKPSAKDNTPGEAKMVWADAKTEAQYYLKETKAPDGCKLNETQIPIVVGIYSIYADAGTADDGVSVLAGVGRLTQTMRQYAENNEVNITLRDITAFMQTQRSGTFDLHGWEDVTLDGTSVLRSMDLHFGKNAVIDYGLHDVDNISGGTGTELNGQILPYFATDTGFIRSRVEQNYPALSGENPKYEPVNTDTNKDNLTGVDLTSLFSLMNVVVVTDQAEEEVLPKTGELAIRKMLTGENLSEADYRQNFLFTVHFEDADGKALTGPFYFWGSDKAGYIHDGETIPLSHDEQIIIQGLPEGTVFTVTEKTVSGWHVNPVSGVIRDSITADARFSAEFINGKNPHIGSLQISKTLVGTVTEADQAEEFTFIVTFEHADGSYSYEVTGGTSGTIASGGSITLRGGETATIQGLPAGAAYTVTEQPKTGWVVDAPANGTMSGTIVQGETASVHFHNAREEDEPGPEPETVSLVLSKTVSGSLTDADREREFTFTVTFENAAGTYSYTGSKTGTIASGGTITLRGGEAVTITGLPKGVKYTVAERAEDGWTAEEGTLSGEINVGMMIAAFKNTKDPDDPPKKPEDPPKKPEDPPKKPEEPVTPPETPEEPPQQPEDPAPPPEDGPPEVPDRPTRLPDPNDPHAPDTITIWDEDVPTTYVRVWDPEEEEWVWIPEDEVPLWFAEVPQTGELRSRVFWTVLTAASLLGAAALRLLGRKKKTK